LATDEATGILLRDHDELPIVRRYCGAHPSLVLDAVVWLEALPVQYLRKALPNTQIASTAAGQRH
jgi:hypothetical protein